MKDLLKLYNQENLDKLGRGVYGLFNELKDEYKQWFASNR